MNNVRVENLELTGVSYNLNSPTWRTITDLIDVTGLEENLPKYLPKRSDESDELYRLRLSKFAYTPIMGQVVSKYTAAIADDSLVVSNTDDALESFMVHKANKDIVQKLLQHLLYYGCTYVVIDTPKLPLVPRSAYELQGLDRTPYTTFIHPTEVLMESEEWVITRQLETVQEPFQPMEYKAVWTYYGQTQDIYYEALVKLKAAQDSKGNICNKIDRVKIGSDWLPLWDDKAVISPSRVYQHGLGKLRVVKYSLDSSKWLCKLLYLKQIQHLRIENAWTDAGYLAGQIQRIFTPPDVPPLDDPRVTYEQPDYTEQLRRAGNTHILVGNGYSFVESSGSALKNLEGQLDKIEAQVDKIAGLHFASGSTSVLNQSGVSKVVDRTLLEHGLSMYLDIVNDILNDILSLVGLLLGKPEGHYVASGLRIRAETVEDVIKSITAIEELPDFPDKAKKLLYVRLVSLMLPNSTPEEKEDILEEIEEIFDTSENLVTPEALADNFGLSLDDAKAVLGGLYG